MKCTFLYPDSPKSPHYVHKSWAESVSKKYIKTPLGFGFFNTNIIPESDVLILESLYCLPFARKYKKNNPNCKIIVIIADTSFWNKKLSISRKIFYKIYLKHVDGFITVSNRIKKDVENYTKKPVIVVRPFIVNKYSLDRKCFNKNIVFIGNDSKEKGFLYAVNAMKYLEDFDLYLVGSCCKKVDNSLVSNNIHKEGSVKSIKKYFQLNTYYIHPADFDPSPVVVWEAMHAGLIPIISKDVGQSEVLNGTLKSLVLTDVNPETIAKRVKDIDKLSEKEKKNIINKCKEIASNYTKEKSIYEFKVKFKELLNLIN